MYDQTHTMAISIIGLRLGVSFILDRPTEYLNRVLLLLHCRDYSGRVTMATNSVLDTDSEDELPAGWEERVTVNGRVYYAK